jgi:ADP-heptose:LPS heptosyltransferase
MGDLVLAVPALRALRQDIPAQSVDLLTSAKGRRAAEECPYIGEIHSLDIQAFIAPGGTPTGGWGELIAQIRRIRKRRYDLAVNLIGHYSPKGAVRMGLLLKLLGIPLLAGRDTLGTGPFYHYALPETLDEPGNERDTNLDLARLLGAGEEISDKLEVWPSDEDEKQADALVNDLAGEGPIVGINPGTDRPEKEWPEECYLEVMRELKKRKNARFVLTGGPADAALTARLAAAFGGEAVDTVGKISFQGTAALMRRSGLFLTLDTAALHLAWAVGLPAVALFKGENLGRYRPVTDKIKCLVGRKGNERSPLDIPAAEVVRACLDQLNAKKTGG